MEGGSKMTREKEIQKLIDEEMGVDNYGSSDYQVGVCDGVRLADKTMIDRACEWLKENVRVFQKKDIGDFILANFRKEMEGGAE
jgi:hypothetical protein